MACLACRRLWGRGAAASRSLPGGPSSTATLYHMFSGEPREERGAVPTPCWGRVPGLEGWSCGGAFSAVRPFGRVTVLETRY